MPGRWHANSSVTLLGCAALDEDGGIEEDAIDAADAEDDGQKVRVKTGWTPRRDLVGRCARHPNPSPNPNPKSNPNPNPNPNQVRADGHMQA